MLKSELQLVLKNVHVADTLDLLDRVTAYRAGMEPDVVAFIEDELEQRGVSAAVIAAHAERCRRECLFHADGSARMCSYCRRPAVARAWGLHRLFRGPTRAAFPVARALGFVFRLLPLGYPVPLHLCAVHVERR